jgi:hypothetical protein
MDYDAYKRFVFKLRKETESTLDARKDLFIKPFTTSTGSGAELTARLEINAIDALLNAGVIDSDMVLRFQREELEAPNTDVRGPDKSLDQFRYAIARLSDDGRYIRDSEDTYLLIGQAQDRMDDIPRDRRPFACNEREIDSVIEERNKESESVDFAH